MNNHDVEENEKNPKSTFFRDRALSIFDNAIWCIVLYGLSIVIPIIWGFLQHLETQILLLLILILCQIPNIILLFSIRARLSIKSKGNRILVHSRDTDNIYLVDRFGLPHIINDKETSLYFLDVLGFTPEEIPDASKEDIKLLGAEIPSIRHWRPPRTKEGEMSNELRRCLLVSPKYFQIDANIISFDIENNSDQVVQINSANLVFSSTTPPLTISDISPKNKPMAGGLLQCRLIFIDGALSKTLSPGEKNRLDLWLKGNLMESDVLPLIGSRFGYIEIIGIFRDTNVRIHSEV